MQVSDFWSRDMPRSTVLYTNFNYPVFAYYTGLPIQPLLVRDPTFYQDLSRQMPADGILIAYKDLNEDPRVEWLDSNPHFRRFKEFPSLLVYEYRVRADAFDQRNRTVVRSRPVGAYLAMDRRTFVKSSFVTASGALLANCGFTAGSPLSQKNIPATVARSQIDRARFPDGFLWGLASAAYQIEGAWNTDVNGESNWHGSSHTVAKIKGSATGDISSDPYHHYKKNIPTSKHLNQKSYRFSTSWARIQPTGTGPVNP